ncbi:hypothetical protein A3D55_01815 [Candidatus Jorgensenbacteria bacterium RIFCSPHIGHO2_02_FULL_45_20]|uniref:Prepilin peptidase n=2 Tax=Candidatus Joergenseniibacteriota TaxID=1752739 RepID=A0A1F6BNS8_9BACT|nr:MAG: Type 4 prepilin-like protein leader peptide-processing enzyme [Candidatus Jorgensenbacteria bacterium GW2011_GWA2_45_9]OGG38584.1 MAG: hypothetical protein A3D55_01815 [Candidatus Jorgensenbacteria bacterium RIFCSPHIGHO2_02_FULL_45_20]
MPTTIFVALLFFFGIAVGSFTNVLIDRYKPEKSLFSLKRLRGRSHCDSCGRTLSAIELIPIASFIFLRGKCRECKSRLSFQYPLVEVVTGAIFAGVPLFLNSFYNISGGRFFLFAAEWWYYALAAFWVIVCLGLLIVFVIDLKHYIVPDELNLFFIIVGILIISILWNFRDSVFPFRESFLKNYVLVFSPFLGLLANRILGFAAGGLFFLILFFASRGRGMGMGDVKLAFALGLLFGWPDVGLSIIISFILGGVFSLALFIAGAKTMKDRVPFAPFLVTGIAATFFFGHALIGWYFSLFGM